MRATHWFVDETKSGTYIVVVAAVSADAIAACRKELRNLLRPGQRSLHFTKESHATRRAALRVIAVSQVEVVVYRVVAKLPAAIAREACLRQIARDSLAAEPSRIVIERDESVVASDRRWLREELGARRRRSVEFVHLDKHEEPLLWVADALAWCIQRGRPWTDLIARLSSRVVDLP